MPNPDFEIENTNMTPPQGWSYRHSNPDVLIKDYDYNRWRKSVEDFFLANDIPMGPNWIERLHSEACSQNPQWGNFCKRWVGKKKENKPVGFATLIQFLKVMGKWVIEGGNFVSQEEAERRASICVQCPYNAPSNNGCGTCMANLLSGIEKIRGNRKTENDSRLGGCKICGCELKVSVHIPNSAQQFGLTDEMRNEFKELGYCWKGENL